VEDVPAKDNKKIKNKTRNKNADAEVADVPVKSNVNKFINV